MLRLILSLTLSAALASSTYAIAQTGDTTLIPGAAADEFTPPPIRGQNPDGMKIYIRAGLKTHGPGQHDEKALPHGFIGEQGGIRGIDC